MRKFEVWYMRPEHFRDGICGLGKPTAADLGATHIRLREIDADNLEAVFVEMQGERWSPNGEAFGMIKALGLRHTSMSVGDVAIDLASREVWKVARFGFEKVE
jgi:hypothetical protein